MIWTKKKMESQRNLVDITTYLAILKKEFLSRTINMLSVTESPININRIKETWFPEITGEKSKSAFPYIYFDEHSHLCVGSNNQIQLYLRKSVWYSKLFPGKCLFYKLTQLGNSVLKKFSKQNLTEDFKNTLFERKLSKFIVNNKIHQKDAKGQYTILNVLDNINLTEL